MPFTYYAPPTVEMIFPRYGSKDGATPVQVWGKNFKRFGTAKKELIDLSFSLVLKKRTFMTQGKENKKDKLLSMVKSLELLIKKTEKECNDHLY